VALIPRAPLYYSGCSLQDHIFKLTPHRRTEVKHMLKVWLEQSLNAQLSSGGGPKPILQTEKYEVRFLAMAGRGTSKTPRARHLFALRSHRRDAVVASRLAVL